MNRRGFFARAIGGALAAVGLRKAAPADNTLVHLDAPLVTNGIDGFIYFPTSGAQSPITPEWVVAEVERLTCRPVWTGNTWSWPK